MKNRLIAIAVLAGSLMLGNVLSAQDTSTTREPLPDDLKMLIQQFREQRAELLQARVQLMEQLRTCTEEQKKELILQFRQQFEEQIRNERHLRRQVEVELRQIRQERRQLRTGQGG